MTFPPDRFRRPTFLLAVITMLAWLPALRCHFVWDDDIVLLSNPHINPPNLQSFLYYWAHPFWNLYTPITGDFYALAAAINYALWRSTAHPLAFHLINILFHCLAAVALFNILRRILNDNKSAFFGSLLFAIHPLQTEPVAFIGALNNPLFAGFSLLALSAYLRSSTRPRLTYILASLSLLAALLCKPTAVVVPFIAILLDRAANPRPWKDILLRALPWIALIIPFVILTAHFQHPSTAGTSPGFRFFIAGDAAAFYFGKIIYPWNLAVDYGRNPTSLLQHTWAYFTWLIPAAILLAAILLRRLSKIPLIAIAIFFIALLPNSGILPFDFQIWSTTADRYAYLPMVGISLLFACATRRFGKIFAVIVLIPLLLLQQRQLTFWRNEQTLFNHTLAINPRSSLAWGNLSHYQLDQHNYRAAADAADRALAINPASSIAWENLGFALTALGDYPSAAAAFHNGVHYDPGNPDALYNCATALRRIHHWDEAIQLYSILLNDQPFNAKAKTGLLLAERKVDSDY